MATIVSVNHDAAEVEQALFGGSRALECRVAADAAAISANLAAEVPDLVVLGGDAVLAADTAEALLDEPRLLGTPVVAWKTNGNMAGMARLLALGANVVEGDAVAFRTACEDALDAREGRTIRVDEPTDIQQPPSDGLDLHGKRIVVADDDPAIAWYFADVLRKRGCDVEEAFDGEAALDRARRMAPDLVISDIRMPKLDGLRLCHALRRDPALADVPVILLSWKEDWLRRAEATHIEASAYLGKRSAPEEILATVAEVMTERERLDGRLRKPGTARGRLDGTAPYRLLRLACATHPDARLILQCPLHGYEVHLRNGAPRSIVRIGRDGSALRAAPALASLLEERAGRFTLDPEQGPVEADLSGSLHQQLAPIVARSRRTAAAPSVTAGEAGSAVVPQATPAVEPMQPASLPSPTAPLRRLPEPWVGTQPMAPLAVAVRTSSEPASPPSESALPIVRPKSRRVSWKGPLRWIGIAAIAALGLVLGAGVRALRQPTPDASLTTKPH